MLRLPLQAFKDSAFVEEAPLNAVQLGSSRCAPAAGGRCCRVGWISQLYLSTVFLSFNSQLCLDVGLYAQYRPNFLGLVALGG